MKHLIATLALVAALFGAVAAAQASPGSRANAVRAAHNYLQTMPFSYKGLIEQLRYDGYSPSDAAYGAGLSGANWMREAVLSARQYLQTMPFSFSGLVEQLEYDGYTPAQARHGAHAAGL